MIYQGELTRMYNPLLAVLVRISEVLDVTVVDLLE